MARVFDDLARRAGPIEIVDERAEGGASLRGGLGLRGRGEVDEATLGRERLLDVLDLAAILGAVIDEEEGRLDLAPLDVIAESIEFVESDAMPVELLELLRHRRGHVVEEAVEIPIVGIEVHVHQQVFRFQPVGVKVPAFVGDLVEEHPTRGVHGRRAVVHDLGEGLSPLASIFWTYARTASAWLSPASSGLIGERTVRP